MPHGGLTADQAKAATFILWDGNCSVHQDFTVAHVAARRGEYPGIRVFVPPECDISVVQAADLHGSTEQIIRAIAESEPATRWAVGTEINLVNRLACRHRDRLVVNLAGFSCLCTTMYRIDLPHLCRALEGLAAGAVVNRIVVPDQVKRDARVALDRMVSLKRIDSAAPTVK